MQVRKMKEMKRSVRKLGGNIRLLKPFRTIGRDHAINRAIQLND